MTVVSIFFIETEYGYETCLWHKWCCEQQELGTRAYETRTQSNKIIVVAKRSVTT